MLDASPDPVVIGGADTDFFMQGERLPDKGESTLARQFECAPGGKGVNQAIAAARLGARVALVSMMGRDKRADDILSRLNEEGVDTRHVSRTDKAATGATLIMIGEHGKTMRMATAGANHCLQVADIERAAALIQSADWVLAQLEVPQAAVERALQIAADSRVRTMLDADPALALPNRMLALIDVIRADADGARTISGVEVKDEESSCAAAAHLLARGARLVALQMPSGGNLVVAPQEAHAFAPLPVSSCDRTGAGDAFSPAFAVALIERQPLDHAGAFANAAAAWATTRIDAPAGLPTRGDIDALRAKMRQTG